MSIRTIVEINHDHLDDLNDARLLQALQRYLASGNANLTEQPYLGHIRLLAQRHHSEEITVKVK